MMKAILWAVAIAVTVPTAQASAADKSATLFRIRLAPDGTRPVWNDGHFSAIAAFQTALRDALKANGIAASEWPAVDGILGPGTQKAIKRLLALPGYSDLAQDGASEPAITAALWTRLLPTKPAPTALERIETLILTYEATPFDSRAEWNFCQSMKATDRRSTKPCLSNDPTSYLTWGPRGATAGGGREIEGVLIASDRQFPTIIDDAFGAEAPAIRRLVRLSERRKAPVVLDAERFLCGIWMDEARADIWANGFAALGKRSEVRHIFFNLYASGDFDGGKVSAFRRLYQAMGRQPTELDLAFFMDRATHTGGVFSPGRTSNTAPAIADVAARVRSSVGDPSKLPAWKVRRALSVILATSNQGPDRNGRDVVFFVDGLGAPALATSERMNWLGRGPRYASDLGLSDERAAPDDPASTTQFPTIAEPRDTLTRDEAAKCPSAVLNWTNPNSGPRKPRID